MLNDFEGWWMALNRVWLPSNSVFNNTGRCWIAWLTLTKPFKCVQKGHFDMLDMDYPDSEFI